MEYFDVQIEGSAAVFQEVSADGERFTDIDGSTVPVPPEPIRYTFRSWCVNRPVWVEQLPPGI